MQVVGFITYIALGLFQLAAIQAGLADWLGLHWLIAIPLAGILAYLPFVGSFLGLLGAVKGWHWEWWQAGLLFFGMFGLSMALAGASVALDHLRSKRLN